MNNNGDEQKFSSEKKESVSETTVDIKKEPDLEANEEIIKARTTRKNRHKKLKHSTPPWHGYDWKWAIIARIKTAFITIFLVITVLGFLAIPNLGPWMLDQDYYPPHLTWTAPLDENGIPQTLSTSITVNFQTPTSVKCKVLYYEKDNPLGESSALEVNEISSTTNHIIELSGLKPNQKYTYWVEVMEGSLKRELIEDLSERHSFLTAPAPINDPSESIPFKVVVTGDNRPNVFGYSQAGTLSKRFLIEQPAFVINTGDVVMTNEGGWMYRRYFLENSYDRDIVTLPTKGNHERFEAENGANTTFERTMHFPNGKNYYAYNYSNAHFISLDFTSKTGPVIPDEQENMKLWLRNDLSNINTTDEIQWVFIYLHYPIYSLEQDPINKQAWNYLVVEELENAHVVPDMIFSGHVHAYEANWIPLGNITSYNSTDYVWNIVTGGGGAETAPVRWLKPDERTTRIELQHHYLILSIDGNKLVMQAKLANGNVFDSITIEKNNLINGGDS